MRKGDGKWEFKLKENGDHTLNWMRLHKTRLDWLHGWVLVGQTEGSLDRTVERSRTTSIFYFRAWFDVLELESHYYKLLLQLHRTILWSGVTLEQTRTLTTHKGTRHWLQQVGSRISPCFWNQSLFEVYQFMLWISFIPNREATKKLFF